jgi:hypothetical protein
MLMSMPLKMSVCLPNFLAGRHQVEHLAEFLGLEIVEPADAIPAAARAAANPSGAVMQYSS